MWILDVLSSAGFGSVVGAIGGFLQKREERALFKEQCSHAVNMIKAKTESALQLADKNIEASKVEGEIEIEKIEAKAFKSSMDNASCYKWVRPLISIYLIMLTSGIAYYVFDLSERVEVFNSEEMIGLIKLVVLQILMLTSVSVGWWFAARTSKGFTEMMNKIIK